MKKTIRTVLAFVLCLSIALSFSAVFLLKRNDRTVAEIPYTADANDYENQTVRTDGFLCRGGRILELSHENGYKNAGILKGEILFDDGTSGEICFCAGSEESLRIETVGYGMCPIIKEIP